MSPQPATQRRVSVDEYLAGERDAELRHEYIDGEVYAMTGASRTHALIVTALTIALGPPTRMNDATNSSAATGIPDQVICTDAWLSG